MPRDWREVLREDRNRLVHMVNAAERVLKYCDGHSRQTLQADEIRLLAVIKLIEVIGEASTKISDQTKGSINGIDWVGMRRMRNRMIHGYDSIDTDRVWDAVELDVKPLAEIIRRVLESWPQDEPSPE